MTLLVYVPISNREWCIDRFLDSLLSLDYPADTSFYFNVNDSTDGTLGAICDRKIPNSDVGVSSYGITPPDHVWDHQAIDKMIRIRNEGLGLAQIKKSDWLFTVDSDILFKNPDMLKHLIALNAPIVSPVFWATWGRKIYPGPSGNGPLPNVWKRGQYETDATFQHLLRKAGHYPVGGLGAATLIRKDVWDAGVKYDRIFNLPTGMIGEDRYFCIRAAVSGFHLTACTCYPVIHLEK